MPPSPTSPSPGFRSPAPPARPRRLRRRPGRRCPHHHCYQLRREQRTGALAGSVLAEWHEVPLRMPLAVEAAWYSLRTSPSLRVQEGAEATHLGLDVEVGRPDNDGRALLGLVKALVDGLVSALHAHDGQDLGTITERLKARLGVEAAALAVLLLEVRLAVLGTRRLLWPYRRFVQWNPADDIIVDLRLSTTPAPRWTTTGTVCSLAGS